MNSDVKGVRDQEWPEAKDAAYQWLRAWFFERYEDPAEHCPYSSAEGGYQYIYGGPVSTEEIADHWGEVFDEAFLAAVVRRLDDEEGDQAWSVIPTESWYH
jgi:hypothetical protein